MTTIAIRHEQPGDENAIYALTANAFRTMPFSEGDEQDLIDAWRTYGDLALSLVAETAGRIVVHIAFSLVTISGRYQWSQPCNASRSVHS